MRTGTDPGTTASAPRPRVLVIAEAANPEWQSVPLVGWSHADALREVADVHLVTQVRNRDAIVRAGLVEGRDFTAIDSERVARPLWHLTRLLPGGWTTSMAAYLPAYLYFERLVWKRFGADIRAGRYDVVHRLTPLSPTVPSPIAARCRKAGVPFVLGPLNGGLPWPRNFDQERRREREWLSYVRGAYKLVPGYRRTRENAAAIVVASRATLEQVPERWRSKCIYIPENGLDERRFHARRERPGSRPLAIVFVGRLVPYKGPDLLLEAAESLLREDRARLTIVGDGPLMASMRAAAAERGVQDKVRFTGWVDHQQVQHLLAAADVFAFPSIREFGGAAPLEAMAVGVPAIVVDYGGPGEIVTEDTGWLLPLGTRANLAAELRALLTRLCADRDAIERRAQAALQRAWNWFAWRVKARQTLEVYRWVLGRRPDRPEFGMPFAGVGTAIARP